jgi:hypothetical protein
MVITDERAKALAKIESQSRCFNVRDTKDYRIAITKNPDKGGEIYTEYYDRISTNSSVKVPSSPGNTAEVPDSEVVNPSASQPEATISEAIITL